MTRCILAFFCGFLLFGAVLFASDYPKRIIYDTDLGGDVDDGLALSLIHAQISRGEVDLLAVTITNASRFVPRYVRMLNAYFGRPDIPIGVPEQPCAGMDGKFMEQTLDRYEAKYVADPDSPLPAESAVPLLRRVLAESPDHSVTFLMVGFATNLARLLDSPADEISPLTGKELIAQKADQTILMAGNYQDRPAEFVEYNVSYDIPAARRIADDWPTPIVWEGQETGARIFFPIERLHKIFAAAPDMPAYDSCCRYGLPNMALWDLVVPFYFIHPDCLRLSEPGRVSFREDGSCVFTPEENGRDRYMILPTEEEITRLAEAFAWLVSQPPKPKE